MTLRSGTADERRSTQMKDQAHGPSDLRPSASIRGSMSIKAFANFDVIVQSWYVAARSRQIKRQQVQSFDLLNRRIAIWRDANGSVHAINARCPHLGADLGQGTVSGACLTCAFHHWTFEADGRCSRAPGHDRAPGRRAVTYLARERFGLIWIWPGQEASFDVPHLPDDDDETCYRRVLPPSQHITCHPHVVIGNGLDIAHFESLHGLQYTSEPRLAQTGPHSLEVRMRGRPTSWLAAWVGGARRREIVARFTTFGPNLAWMTVEGPLRFHVLFTGRPSSRRGCDTQTVLFLPRGLGFSALRAIALTYSLLHDDRRILDRMDFHPGFSATDEPLRRFAELVNRMDVA